MSTSWSAGLIKTISDSKNIIISSDKAVVIADKYPKARYHYLVLPKTDINSIFQLTRTNLSLLEELNMLGCNIIELKRMNIKDFNLGFHVQPSMQRLHMHVISKDFDSNHLKTKKHWISFNSSLFMPFEALIAQLQFNGRVNPPNTSLIECLAHSDLKCNQCEFVTKNMKRLKQHLVEHFKTN